MTNAEIIATIRTEIERVKAEHPIGGFGESFEAGCDVGYCSCCGEIADFLANLEKSLHAKDADDKVLEVEAVSYCFDSGLNISPRVAADFARHFYDLGCRRTAERADEIEYNRQREEESEKPMEQDGLEEEIKRY